MNLEIEDDGSLVEKCFPQFDFSGILGFPNEGYDPNWVDHIGLFHGCIDSLILHVASLKIMVDLSGVHEGVVLMTSTVTLEDAIW